jgi:hypothetical protein
MSVVSSISERAVVGSLNPARLASPLAARYIGIAPKTMSNMRWRGEGPRYTRAGRPKGAVYYLVADLDAWLQQQAAHGIGGQQ